MKRSFIAAFFVIAGGVSDNSLAQPFDASILFSLGKGSSGGKGLQAEYAPRSSYSLLLGVGTYGNQHAASGGVRAYTKRIRSIVFPNSISNFWFAGTSLGLVSSGKASYESENSGLESNQDFILPTVAMIYPEVGFRQMFGNLIIIDFSVGVQQPLGSYRAIPNSKPYDEALKEEAEWTSKPSGTFRISLGFAI